MRRNTSLFAVFLVSLCLIGVFSMIASVKADEWVPFELWVPPSVEVVAKFNPWYVSEHFNAKLGQPNYEAQCDLDGNGIINMKDIAIAMSNLHPCTEPAGHIDPIHTYAQ